MRSLRRGRGPRPRARPRPRTRPREPALLDNELGAVGALPRQPSAGPVAVPPPGTRRRSAARFAGTAAGPRRRARSTAGSIRRLRLPTEVSAVSNPASGADVLLRWKNTSNSLSQVAIARGRDVCPTTVDGGEANWREPANPGQIQTFEDFGSGPLASGLYCYTLWSFDEAGRTAGPTTVWVNHTDGFLPPSGLTATPDPAPDVAVRLQWTSAAHPRADCVLDHAEVWEQLSDRSARRRGRLARLRRLGTGGRRRTWDDVFPELGTWCYAVFSAHDDSGRYSRTAATDRRATSAGTGARARTARGRARAARGRRRARGSRTPPRRRPSRPRGGSP